MIKLLLTSLFAVYVQAAVLGIDFGSEFIKAVLISPGKSFTIIENTTTKRKTENAVKRIINHRLHSTVRRGFMRVMEQPRRQNHQKIHSYS